MTQPGTEDVIRAASAALGRGDLGALRDRYFDENVVWHVAGSGPLAGDYEGVAQVIAQLEKVTALARGTVRPELQDIQVGDDQAVVHVTITAERAGKQIRMSLSHVVHAENGKATEIWTSTDDPAAAAAFWS